MLLNIFKDIFYFLRLREEIDRVIGSRLEIKYEDLNELKYLGCVIKETLRLWPVVPLLNRKIDTELKINDITVPKGTSIFVIGIQIRNFFF